MCHTTARHPPCVVDHTLEDATLAQPFFDAHGMSKNNARHRASQQPEPGPSATWHRARLLRSMLVAASTILAVYPAPAPLAPEPAGVTVQVTTTVIHGDPGPPLRSTMPLADTSERVEDVGWGGRRRAAVVTVGDGFFPG